ncbi:MAG TPA: ribulose-phosphate 3-epimerase [Blastocatellia bacterium]|nr:ribulose-phosphate 3-epimerase [Blastocatellia bacterium]
MTNPRVEIAPSILSADFARLGEHIHMVETGGADIIHVDVMDGHFVPNLTLGPPVVSCIRKITKLPLDTHLMIEAPERSIEAFADAGANMISVHPEASIHLHRTIGAIRKLGCSPGVVLNPATPLGVLDDILADVDYVLIMSVNPGFGGQKFIEHSVTKVRRLRDMIRGRGLATRIEIDGGISFDTVERVVEAGAEMLVAGSAIFGDADPAGAVGRLRQAALQQFAV